ncbi:hypothetical protein SAMN06264364_101213 [Quadrisphaera granulorum]|uniref:Uncharacterized protein n=1 Tax=Quadrisphaera granulorum TaxID=317664 RepID=A0A316AG52_9ACTN|nr:hypothetical protein [Quadrisphaera granulorum]PWJ56238.1 hypothetical protein BXY45_101213 [Quadrisphaera granulorum]SZE94872.1 hypothetical protein SAMN06264364_101213 [Quadrisphaera granulorum]
MAHHETSLLVSSAESPQEWADTCLRSFLRSEDPSVDERERAWLTSADLFADGAAHLRESHRRIMKEHSATPAAAAKWLVGWYPGRVAHALGYAYANRAASITVDADQLRFGRHPDGWTQVVDFGSARFVVSEAHPWAGSPGVDVVADEADVVATGLTSLVCAAEPVVDAVRTLARVGRAALWAEVADAFVLAGRSTGHASPGAVVERLNAAVRTPGAPWRSPARLWITNGPGGRATIVGQKGGCCLAYQCPTPPDEDLDEQTRAWYALFPADRHGRHYCNTCSLISPQDCQARQLAEQAPAPGCSG